MRSSQPMTGTNGRRCKDDERLVNAVLGIGRRGYILDTRSQNNAKIAQTKGRLTVIAPFPLSCCFKFSGEVLLSFRIKKGLLSSSLQFLYRFGFFR